MNRLGRICAIALLAASALPNAVNASPGFGKTALTTDTFYDAYVMSCESEITNPDIHALFDTGDTVLASAFCTETCFAGDYTTAISIYAKSDRSESLEAAFVESERSEDGTLTIGSRLWELLFSNGIEQATAKERKSLIVGGAVFGTRIKEAKVTVTSGDEGGVLREGDKIISINGQAISSVKDIKEILSISDGSPLSIICKRGGKHISLTLSPKLVGDNWRLGAVLREGAAGLGTITYIDPATGEFGGLGHGICDPDSGEIVEMSGGIVTDVILGGVVKGEGGKPGELSGILTDRNAGEIYTNTDSGVFGKLTKIPTSCTEVLPIAYRNEVKAGKATIVSTLKNGKTMEYSVEIFDVKENATGTKCFKIKVTDPALLAISGGIVRGMSGSPIKQGGKLVGAVTHVMVADPTEGYGIFIENMLEVSRQSALPKAA